jgi:hypothetical protein
MATHNSPILDVNLTIVDSPEQNFTNQKPHWPQPSPITYNKTEPERKSVNTEQVSSYRFSFVVRA